jgi:hypothetical protein
VREASRCETAIIEGPPPAEKPTREQIAEVAAQIEHVLPQLSGGYRSRMRSLVSRLHRDLDEALRHDDEPKAIQRMAELRNVRDQLIYRRGQVLDPPWVKFEQLVKDCLDLAAAVAEQMQGNRKELSEPIHVQQQRGEQAYEQENQVLVRDCCMRLERYAGQLVQLLREHHPEPENQQMQRPPWLEAREAAAQFRAQLADVWKRVRAGARVNLEQRLMEVATLAKGLSQRVKDDPAAALREVRQLQTRIANVEQRLEEVTPRRPQDEAGLLESS